MALTFPVLSSRGELSVALKEVWPGSFRLKRQRHGFNVTLTHAALNGSATLRIDDDDLRDAEMIARDTTWQAWARLLGAEDVGMDDRRQVWNAFDLRRTATRSSAR